MKPSHACLSSWPIDLAEIFASNGLGNTTEEHLSRLESFISAFFLFDKIFIPDKYQASSFIRSIDPEREIFFCDSRISGTHKTTADGRAVIDLDLASLYKNGKHLRSKAAGWLEQHMVFDLPKPERKNLIALLRKRSGSAPCFHQILLAEYQTLFELSVLNDAFSVAFASVCQIYLTDLTELSQFVVFLEKAIRKSGAHVQRDEVAGIFNFEFPTGGVESRIKTPRFFDAFIERLESEDFISALANLRKTYEPLRDAFRAIADAFLKHPGGALVSSNMAGAELEQWNGYVDQNFEASDGALLLKSDVLAVEIHAGLEPAEIWRTLRDRIKACTSLLRFVPAQSYSLYSRTPQRLSALKVKNVIPFERRLLRVGGAGSSKRWALHGGVVSTISFELSAGQQLTQAQLNDPAIRAFGDEAMPHLYMICTRPRITLNPEVRIRQDQIDLEFLFQHSTHTESIRLPFPTSGVRSATVDESTRTHIVFKGNDGQEASWPASRLYQSAVKSMIPEGTAFPLFDHILPDGFSKEQLSALERSDLEIIYIGQSKGRDMDRTAVTRLDRHEKWDVFYRHVVEENPHLEIWIILLSQPASYHVDMMIPDVRGSIHDVEELRHRIRNPARINPADAVNFVEAALISHFKPRYNHVFKKGAFPSRKHESYERLFIAPMDVAAIQLETWTSLGCRLYSKNIASRFVHLKTFQLNASLDMDQFCRKA
jgi:hypothetical protein